MYLEKVISRKTFTKKLPLSTPKCHRSGTLQTTIINVLMQVKVEALKLMEVVLTTWHSLTKSADLFSVEDLARRLHLELSRASVYSIHQSTSNKRLGSPYGTLKNSK
jgi:hypothetical protein